MNSNDAPVPEDERNISQESSTPEDPLEIVPPEKREALVQHVFSMFMSSFTFGQPANPLLGKFNDEHIAEALRQADKSAGRTHELQLMDRRLLVALVLLLVIVFCAGVVWLLPRDRELLLLLIQFLVLLAGGIGTGVGIMSRRSRS